MHIVTDSCASILLIATRQMQEQRIPALSGLHALLSVHGRMLHRFSLDSRFFVSGRLALSIHTFTWQSRALIHFTHVITLT